MERKESESFLKTPYAKRKLIVVVDDSAVEAEKDWTAVVKEAFEMYWRYMTIPGWIQAAIKAARDQKVNVLPVPRSESTVLQFPLGHPQDGVLYVCHPAVHEIYYPAAQFHRLTFEHKFSEAIELLMALGAIEISVEHQVGWGSEFSASLNVPIGKTGEQAGTAAGGHSKKQQHLLFQSSLEGTSEPLVPDGLVWYPYEPTWQIVANGRTQSGLKDFSLSLRYDNDFGINADLEAKAGKAGFNLGGNFENHESTIWKIQGSFKTS